MLNVKVWVEQLLLDQFGYDEGECEWIEKDCLKNVFELDFLVYECGQYKVYDEVEDECENIVDCQVLDGNDLLF